MMLRMQIRTSYTAAELKDGLRVKGSKLTGLKQYLVDRLAHTSDMPSEKLLEQVVEIMNEQVAKPRIQEILTEETFVAWLTSAWTAMCTG